MSQSKNILKIQAQEDELKNLSFEEFIAYPGIADFYAKYSDRFKEYVRNNPLVRVGKVLAGNFVIAYTPIDKFRDLGSFLAEDLISIFPIVLGLLDRESLVESGIIQVQNQPYLDLKGQGVILGFIDTGIDYTKDAFKYEDGTSKIQYIWDQTIKNENPPKDFNFGTEYSNEKINEALASENPFEIVPHTDTVGHGTFLASVAGGREQNEYLGAAPDADIVAVKLKRAKQEFYAAYNVPETQENAYQSSDVMLGIQYIIQKAQELKKPVAICLALGSNYGGHDGLTFFEEYISYVASISGVAICTAVGNESNAKHHTKITMTKTGESQEILLKSGENETAFNVFLVNYSSDRFSISVKSPAGEIVAKVPAKSETDFRTKLILEKSTVSIRYYFPIAQNGGQLSYVVVKDPTPGIWTITVYGDIIINGTLHAWLPMTGFIDPETVFLTPVPEYTVVSPGTAFAPICCGAYSSADGSLYDSSSWGPTMGGRLAPDLVAPGVAVKGVLPTGYGTMTGTSVAAAITTGACALMLQWGAVEGNYPILNSLRIRSFLIRGCKRDPNMKYPNNQWGYGKLDLIETFNALKST